MTPPITPHEAYLIASQWGSYMRNGDPGAVFYSFPLDGQNRGDARPQDDDHRAALIAYTDDCLSGLNPDDADYVEDKANLTILRRFFETSPDVDGNPPLLALAPGEGFNSTTQAPQGEIMTGAETWNSLS